MKKVRKCCIYALLAACSLSLQVAAQQPQFSQRHGVYDAPFKLSLTLPDSVAEGTVIRYTVDASEPTTASTPYTEPIEVKGTTIVRAASFLDGKLKSNVVTATYLYIDDVVQQPDFPEGYPTEWGKFCQIQGTAPADYGMDQEMASDPVLRTKIAEGLSDLPILSIVTDRDNLFSHENDSVRGGIYIFTGPPVGDATGHGWTRPASVELFNPSAPDTTYDFTVGCGLRLHGGHGRLAEKNPKHSFRLVFKEKYGAKTLQYPLFGKGEPSKFDQLVLRCHFGNSWQHWAEGNRQKAQYTRDVWARRMQRRMGRTSVNSLYVNLFLNGMYWGLYNIAERVDDQYGKDHLGGKKSAIDVIKIEEDGGNHIEASEGDLEAWNRLVETARKAADEEYYQQLDTLLDIDGFIDYMLINQYGGNTDWDHHNWYAIRRRGANSQGFRFLCWDSEIILENPTENALGKNNGSSFPTGIFQSLLRNDRFARRYQQRAREVLADDGLLGSESVVEVWDSLYHTISKALYAEAARWGDYRRDVHRYQTAGQLYTVDDQFMTERRRLLDEYFPYRSETVLNQILAFVGIDDFEAPEGWVKLTASMFREWDGTDADAQPKDKQVNVDWNIGQNVGGGGAVAGFVNVDHNQFADLSDYDQLVLRGTGSGLRILANRLVPHGPWKQIVVSFNASDPYWNSDYQAIVLPLSDLKTMADTDRKQRVDDFVHLNALKVDWTSNVSVSSAYLVPAASTSVEHVNGTTPSDGLYYNLQGQQVAHPSHGIYIKNGRKVVVK